MRFCAFLDFTFLLAASSVSPSIAHGKTDCTGDAVMREINLARQHPDAYANILEARRGNFRGQLFVLENGSLLRTHEGTRALDEAIRFLRRAQPLPPLQSSIGMSQAAAEHVADQAGGAFGHDGSDHSNPGLRLNHYGAWSGAWGENISYGKTSAREIVAALIIDDGQRARKHRKNIFNPAFNIAGAAAGPHARYRTVCSIDFAGGYAERSAGVADSLLARN